MKSGATIQLNGKRATGIEVSHHVMAAFESKRPAVIVTLKGYTYRSTVGSMGGRFLIPLGADVSFCRRRCGSRRRVGCRN